MTRAYSAIMSTFAQVIFIGASIEVKRCTAFSQTPLVPRLTLDEFLSSPVYTTPVLIRDIVSPETIDGLGDELMSTLGQAEIEMQRKIKDIEDGSSQSTEIYDIPLQESIEYMMDSTHYDSFFAFCEGLLPSSIPGSSTLSTKLKGIREAPFAGTENWFDYFPSEIQPTDAIILAGAGATSTFHRDPFEWTGTSLCLEGTKIWRFILPPSESKGGISIVDDALESYRLDSIAWDDKEDNNSSDNEPVVLSAGWQSDMTLYDTIDNDFPSAFEWVTMEEEDSQLFQNEIEDAATDLTCIQPSAAAFDALDGISKANGSNERPSASVVTAIQQTGDLLLIPAHCWHQTYAPLPSIAVASQRCGANIDGRNVISHVLDILKYNDKKEELPDILKCNSYTEGAGKEVVSKLLDLVST